MKRILYDGHGKGSKSRLFQLYPYAYSEGVRDGQKAIGRVGLVGIDETSKFTEEQMKFLLTRTSPTLKEAAKNGSGVVHGWWNKGKEGK